MCLGRKQLPLLGLAQVQKCFGPGVYLAIVNTFAFHPLQVYLDPHILTHLEGIGIKINIFLITFFSWPVFGRGSLDQSQSLEYNVYIIYNIQCMLYVVYDDILLQSPFNILSHTLERGKVFKQFFSRGNIRQAKLNTADRVITLQFSLYQLRYGWDIKLRNHLIHQ